VDLPETRYADRGGVSIAYQVFGSGPVDLVLLFGAASHLEMVWTSPGFADFAERLGSFARVVFYDKGGTGLSDPVPGVPTLDERVDEVVAVMDAAGMEQAVLMGQSEGAPVAALLAATSPERVTKLVLYGSVILGREMMDILDELAARWGTGTAVELFGSQLRNAAAATPRLTRSLYGTFERTSASPGMFRAVVQAARDIDIRPILPLVKVPTLVLHRVDDPIPVDQGRLAAAGIPGAKLVELPGDNHFPWLGDSERLLGEVEEFLTGGRSGPSSEGVLAIVLFTDVVRSTERLAEVGDRSWATLLDRYEASVRAEILRYRGREVFTKGDEFFIAFDGPARAVECAVAIRGVARSLQLEVRTGVHAGECEVRGDDLAGLAVHIAARVMSEARPGEILVSSTVRDLIAGTGMRFTDRGRHELRGVPGDWQLFAVGDEVSELPQHEDTQTRVDRLSTSLAVRAPGLTRRMANWQWRRAVDKAERTPNAVG
jgi:class 3 adenylate cyclase/pimeloyl-ACP methyl ester carboxylesterase